MKKYFVAGLVVVVFLAFSTAVGADTVFNEMSKCIQGKGCSMCQKQCEASQAAAPAKDKKCCCKKTDVLGNKVPCCTDNSGKLELGK